MLNTTSYQPEFVENVVAAVQAEINEVITQENLVVVRPDYTKPLDMQNLYRTTMYIGQAPIAPEKWATHLSNIAYDNGATMAVIFETNPGREDSVSVTRHYQSPTQMALKEHKSSLVTHHSNVQIHLDIAEFILTGKAPN